MAVWKSPPSHGVSLVGISALTTGQQRKMPPKILPRMASTLVQSLSLACLLSLSPLLPPTTPSFAAARGIFLNRAAHATPLSIPFYGLNCNPNSSPWPTWHLRTWEIPVWSSLRLRAQSRSFSRCSLLFFEHSKNSLHIAPAHLLYPETWSTRCLAQCLAFSNPTINSSWMNGSMFH